MSDTTRYERDIYQRSRRKPISYVAQGEELSEAAVQAISAPELGLALDVVESRSKERLFAWCEEREEIEGACSDRWDDDQAAAAEKLPDTRQVGDGFHGMKNLNDAWSKTRRAIEREADEARKALLKGCLWLLGKNRENRTSEEQEKRERLFAVSPE